ncbi:hypothetical protein CMEL01_08223 [Colletotrichum melonis]|uniref:Uncharacterized protein n=1 Tax=Colletotrichum melonis TaxID=1209925 RepID=A0AAI9XGR0_9PEZI|nr:hypothetical protein CMEL01_08223 [Colletotrichum melonis]
MPLSSAYGYHRATRPIIALDPESPRQSGVNRRHLRPRGTRDMGTRAQQGEGARRPSRISRKPSARCAASTHDGCGSLRVALGKQTLRGRLGWNREPCLWRGRGGHAAPLCGQRSLTTLITRVEGEGLQSQRQLFRG